jgi:hypothetical protein
MRNHWILVLDDAAGSLRALVPRIDALGLPTRRVESIADAVAQLRIRHGRVAAVIDVGVALSRPAEVAGSLSAAAGGAIRLLLAGHRPPAARCAALRTAGYALALWEPVDDSTLRFLVNLALGASPRGAAAKSASTKGAPRVETRVPTPLVAQVHRADRETPAIVYNISATGAFLETPRPSARGAHLDLELPLPSGPVVARAVVTHANVPGNLQRSQLPVGMGVRFEDLTPEVEAAIRSYVALRAQELAV